MICPAKGCLSEIEEDSIYCDQCGIELLICPKCGNIGEKKFCSKDGTKMISRKNTSDGLPSGFSPSSDTPKIPIPPPPLDRNTIHQSPPSQIDDSTKTKVQPRPSYILTLRHTSGREIVIQNGDILGRKNGPHAGTLGSFAYISGTHAQLKQQDGKWYISDLGSSNGSKINGKDIEPKKEVLLESNDKLQLADQEFTVIL